MAHDNTRVYRGSPWFTAVVEWLFHVHARARHPIAAVFLQSSLAIYCTMCAPAAARYENLIVAPPRGCSTLEDYIAPSPAACCFPTAAGLK